MIANAAGRSEGTEAKREDRWKSGRRIGSESPILPHDRINAGAMDTSVKRKVPNRMETNWNYKLKEDIWRDRLIWRRSHDRNCNHDQVDRDGKRQRCGLDKK